MTSHVRLAEVIEIASMARWGTQLCREYATVGQRMEDAFPY